MQMLGLVLVETGQPRIAAALAADGCTRQESSSCQTQMWAVGNFVDFAKGFGSERQGFASGVASCTGY